MKFLRILLIVIIISISCDGFAQMKRIGLPYTRALNVGDHDASKQNWGAVMDKNGIMYFANNYGVVIHDGFNWDLVKTNIAVKRIFIDNESDSIYVGLSSDFGVLRRNANNVYAYHSLVEQYGLKEDKCGTIQGIVKSPTEGLVFLGQKYLYIINGDSVHSIYGEGSDGASFTGIYEVDGKLLVCHASNGIKELRNGELHSIHNLNFKNNQPVVYITSKKNGYIIAALDGIYETNDTSCTLIDKPINKLLANNINCAIKTHDGNLLFGSNKCLMATDSELNIIQRVPTSTINAIYEDYNHLVWLSNQNDVMVMDLYSPFSDFPNSTTDIRESVKSILQVNDNLYIGSASVYQINMQDLGYKKFTELPNIQGQGGVWSLDTINGQIIGGTNRGLISIDPNTNELTCIDANQNRNIRNVIIPEGQSNIMVATGGNALSTYIYNDGMWKYRGGVACFEGNGRTRRIEQDKSGAIWVSDASNGVYKLKLNANYDTVLSVESFNADRGLPSDIDNLIIKNHNDVCISTIDGLYTYSADSAKPMYDAALNKLFGGSKEFETMYNDQRGNIWAKHIVKTKRDQKSWYLEKYTISNDSVVDYLEKPFRPYQSNINAFGYIGDSCYIIGDGRGFTHYDSKIVKDFNMPYKALINKLEGYYNDSLLYGGNLNGMKLTLPYSQHSIRITFSAAFYEYPNEIKFKTFLENNEDEWTDFRALNFKEFPSLAPGKYTMHVIAINCYNNESEEATLIIEILPPWYLTIWAKIIYVILFILLIWYIIKMYTQKLKRDNQKLEKIVEERTSEIREQSKLIMDQNAEIVQKNKSITDSINYAKHIQTAMLPLHEKISAVLPNHFILFRPKDIVSGDYYWFADTEKYIVITAADCTGHGVPGAFMSMIGSQILTEIVAEGITSPDEILTNQNRRIRKALKQDTTENHDGMDMALCTINKETHVVEFAGAKNQLVVIKNGELTEYKADKQGIGGSQLYGDDFQYSKTAIETDGNTWFYMFSDGYKDQFGGPDNSKFLIKRLRKLLLDIHEKSPEEQRKILDDTIQDWIDAGKGEQTDDIILMGFKL